MTPHNEAQKGDYAEAVLLPGDPDRAAYIAETFLQAARRVNTVRGALGFTGTYRGMPVSVQTTGIGRPSLSIYVHELLNAFAVKTIVRVGSCGGLEHDVPLRSLVIARSAVMDFEIANADAWRRSDDLLFERACRRANADRLTHLISAMVSSDVFYHADPLGRFSRARARGVLACDMETSAVYGLAQRFGARALSICTVVDNLATGEEIAISERQEVFGPMVKLALDALVDDFSAGQAAGSRLRRE